MKNSSEMLITDVVLSDDKEHIIFHTKDKSDSNRLWSQLAGQALDRTEGRRPIPYNMPEDFPVGTTLEVEADTDQIILLLEYLEIEMKDSRFLVPGTTERIRKQIESYEKSSTEGKSFSNL